MFYHRVNQCVSVDFVPQFRVNSILDVFVSLWNKQIALSSADMFELSSDELMVWSKYFRTKYFIFYSHTLNKHPIGDAAKVAQWR